jgi:hypothetical protein
MPRYYLHIHEPPSEVIVDREGQEFADLAAAVASAERSRSEIVAELRRSNRSPAGCKIVIVDGADKVLAEVYFDTRH